VNTDAVEPELYAGYVKEWIEAGANIVGGCCGTVPETIKGIK
jgi:5-methyltetrahydrofolate--homocysteine methyltransferase